MEGAGAPDAGVSTSCEAEYTAVQEMTEANPEEDGGPIYLDPAICSQESDSDQIAIKEYDSDQIAIQRKTPYSIGSEIKECLDSPFVATNQRDEILFGKFKTMYQKVTGMIKGGSGILSCIPKEPTHTGHKSKRSRKHRIADDILETIILTTVER